MPLLSVAESVIILVIDPDGVDLAHYLALHSSAARLVLRRRSPGMTSPTQ